VICCIIFYVYNKDSRFSFAFNSIDDLVYASFTGLDALDFLAVFAARTAFILAFILALRSTADFAAGAFYAYPFLATAFAGAAAFGAGAAFLAGDAGAAFGLAATGAFFVVAGACTVFPFIGALAGVTLTAAAFVDLFGGVIYAIAFGEAVGTFLLSAVCTFSLLSRGASLSSLPKLIFNFDVKASKFAIPE